MFKKAELFFLIAETPVHPGSGSEIGIVDLPIQREGYTKYPKIEASGLKGCIREAFGNTNPEISINGKQISPKDKIKYGKNKETDYISIIFGSEDIGEAHAGAISFTDARILLFPVKSLKGVFAWITCPLVLERFKKDLELADIVPDEKVDPSPNTISELNEVAIDSKVVLEEYTFEVKIDDKTTKIAKYLAEKIFQGDPYKFWREKLEKSLIILSDDDFEQFVVSSTEIITRTKIDELTGTVKSGALWTEEYLPQDTIMYSLAMASPLRVEDEKQKGIFKEFKEKESEKVIEFLKNGMPKIIQIGGNQTIGKGLMRVQFLKQGGKK